MNGHVITNFRRIFVGVSTCRTLTRARPYSLTSLLLPQTLVSKELRICVQTDLARSIAAPPATVPCSVEPAGDRQGKRQYCEIKWKQGM